MPDSPESRIGRLEQEVSALKQRIDDVSKDVETLDEARMAIVELKSMVRQIEREITSLSDAVVDDRKAAQERGREMTEEMKALRENNEKARKEDAATRRQQRFQYWGLIVTVLVALIAMGGTILAAVLS